MTNEEIIELAIESLGKIAYQTKYPAYYVVINGEDRQGEDQCEDCIDAEIAKQKHEDREERARIRAIFKEIRSNGNVYKDKTYTNKEVRASEKYKLKDIPTNRAEYSYESHDPDFGGGLYSPCSCESCGEYFSCEFKPDGEELDYLESMFEGEVNLTDKNKWELEAALNYYEYCDTDIQLRLIEVAKKLVA